MRSIGGCRCERLALQRAVLWWREKAENTEAERWQTVIEEQNDALVEDFQAQQARTLVLEGALRELRDATTDAEVFPDDPDRYWAARAAADGLLALAGRGAGGGEEEVVS